jgi:gamma-glutamylcyclotransferase (GGCT)/AIG2-like uncharacterized protein YtfP
VNEEALAHWGQLHQKQTYKNTTLGDAQTYVVLTLTASTVWGLLFELPVKVKVKFNLGQATKAQRGSRGIALPFP